MGALKHIMASAAFCTLVAISALPTYAQDASSASNPVTDFKFTVPVKDMRGESHTNVLEKSAELSSDGFTLVIFGFAANQYDAPNKAIEYTRDQGFKAGIILSDGNSPHIDVFIDGYRVLADLDVNPKEASNYRYFSNALGYSFDKYKEYKEQGKSISGGNYSPD